MFKNRLGEDWPILKFIHVKIRRRGGVESLTTLEEGEFKVPIMMAKTAQYLVHSLNSKQKHIFQIT